jgi:hypothetical protein
MRPEVRADGRGDVLPVRAVRDGEARMAVASTDVRGWWWATDVLAGTMFSGGPLPNIYQTVELVPVGVQSGLFPMRLPTGRLVDLIRDDLGLGFVEERQIVRADSDLPSWRRDLWDRMLKGVSVAACFGNLARGSGSRSLPPFSIRPSVPTDRALWCVTLCWSGLGVLLARPGRNGHRLGPACHRATPLLVSRLTAELCWPSTLTL